MRTGRVAIVDDDRAFSDAVCALLKEEGYTPVTALTGQEAEVLLLNEPADVAVVDVHLPDVDGVEVVKALRNAGRTLPVIMISSDDHPRVLSKCKTLGLNKFMLKPLDPAELLQMIDHVLTLKKPRSHGSAARRDRTGSTT